MNPEVSFATTHAGGLIRAFRGPGFPDLLTLRSQGIGQNSAQLGSRVAGVGSRVFVEIGDKLTYRAGLESHGEAADWALAVAREFDAAPVGDLSISTRYGCISRHLLAQALEV